MFHPYPDSLSTHDQLKLKINAELVKQKGTFAVAFKDLGSGEELVINEHLNFHAASTMKTPVLIETYKQAATGKFSIADSILVKNKFKNIADGSTYTLNPASDSETDLYTKIGTKLPVYDLLYRMIIESSNLATNLIIELTGAENVTETMRKLGAKNISVLRGVEDTKAYEKGLNNTTTAYDLMLIFANLAEGKTVNKESSDAMLRILLDQKFNDKIPAKLPADVKVAHKTGSITGVNHDSGIVFLPDGRKYVLVLLSKDIEDEKAAVNAMANVSAMIYEYFNQ